jgi:hypothetical protein
VFFSSFFREPVLEDVDTKEIFGDEEETLGGKIRSEVSEWCSTPFSRIFMLLINKANQ